MAALASPYGSAVIADEPSLNRTRFGGREHFRGGLGNGIGFEPSILAFRFFERRRLSTEMSGAAAHAPSNSAIYLRSGELPSSPCAPPRARSRRRRPRHSRAAVLLRRPAVSAPPSGAIARPGESARGVRRMEPLGWRGRSDPTISKASTVVRHLGPSSDRSLPNLRLAQANDRRSKSGKWMNLRQCTQ